MFKSKRYVVKMIRKKISRKNRFKDVWKLIASIEISFELKTTNQKCLKRTKKCDFYFSNFCRKRFQADKLLLKMLLWENIGNRTSFKMLYKQILPQDFLQYFLQFVIFTKFDQSPFKWYNNRQYRLCNYAVYILLSGNLVTDMLSGA